MVKEKIPEIPEQPIDFEERKREILRRKKDLEVIKVVNPPRIDTGEIYARRKFIQDKLDDLVGREKWHNLRRKFRKLSILNPSKDDMELAEKFRKATDLELLTFLAGSNERLWDFNPSAYKTLGDELERRMKGEDS